MPDKKTLILDCGIKLLISSGDTGLTLRKLAESADMRLSNVQYYFKSRDDGIVAMVQRYFEQCRGSLLHLTETSLAKTRRERVALLVPYFEGYSVTARALSMDLDSVSEMLTDMAPGACNGR